MPSTGPDHVDRPTDADLRRLIDDTLRSAREAGEDFTGQRKQAVAAVLRARPDLTASDDMQLADLRSSSMEAYCFVA